MMNIMMGNKKKEHPDVIVVGGGAAGMFCAALASETGLDVALLEQNEKLGKKLFITGKGRCNFTNACSPEEFRSNVVTNPKFLYSASEALCSQDVIDLFERWGLRTKVERGRRAFPASDHSSDVIAVLEKRLHAGNVKISLHTRVLKLLTAADHKDSFEAAGVEYERGGMRERLYAKHVVLATGGLSYPSTGATGDGYRFAREVGLEVTKLSPSLVPINCKEEYVKALQGLSLKNVELRVHRGKKLLFSEFGELLFTHFGISGPLVLSASAVLGRELEKGSLPAEIDLKPAVLREQLDARFVRVFSENPKKAVKNVLPEFYPAKLCALMPGLAGIADELRCCDISKLQREMLLTLTKALPLTLSSLRGYNEAVITKGGIAVREIDPRTMEAKRVKGLYTIGEVLDVDAYTGGYNLQIAWCTAAACARQLAKAYGLA